VFPLTVAKIALNHRLLHRKQVQAHRNTVAIVEDDEGEVGVVDTPKNDPGKEKAREVKAGEDVAILHLLMIHRLQVTLHHRQHHLLPQAIRNDLQQISKIVIILNRWRKLIRLKFFHPILATWTQMKMI
jgi:hypothetical protein